MANVSPEHQNGQPHLRVIKGEGGLTQPLPRLLGEVAALTMRIQQQLFGVGETPQSVNERLQGYLDEAKEMVGAHLGWLSLQLVRPKFLMASEARLFHDYDKTPSDVAQAQLLIPSEQIGTSIFNSHFYGNGNFTRPQMDLQIRTSFDQPTRDGRPSEGAWYSFPLDMVQLDLVGDL